MMQTSMTDPVPQIHVDPVSNLCKQMSARQINNLAQSVFARWINNATRATLDKNGYLWTTHQIIDPSLPVLESSVPSKTLVDKSLWIQCQRKKIQDAFIHVFTNLAQTQSLSTIVIDRMLHSLVTLYVDTMAKATNIFQYQIEDEGAQPEKKLKNPACQAPIPPRLHESMLLPVRSYFRNEDIFTEGLMMSRTRAVIQEALKQQLPDNIKTSLEAKQRDFTVCLIQEKAETLFADMSIDQEGQGCTAFATKRCEDIGSAIQDMLQDSQEPTNKLLVRVVKIQEFCLALFPKKLSEEDSPVVGALFAHGGAPTQDHAYKALTYFSRPSVIDLAKLQSEVEVVRETREPATSSSFVSSSTTFADGGWKELYDQACTAIKASICPELATILGASQDMLKGIACELSQKNTTKTSSAGAPQVGQQMSLDQVGAVILAHFTQLGLEDLGIYVMQQVASALNRIRLDSPQADLINSIEEIFCEIHVIVALCDFPDKNRFNDIEGEIVQRTLQQPVPDLIVQQQNIESSLELLTQMVRNLPYKLMEQTATQSGQLNVFATKDRASLSYNIEEAKRLLSFFPKEVCNAATLSLGRTILQKVLHRLAIGLAASKKSTGCDHQIEVTIEQLQEHLQKSLDLLTKIDSCPPIPAGKAVPILNIMTASGVHGFAAILHSLKTTISQASPVLCTGPLYFEHNMQISEFSLTVTDTIDTCNVFIGNLYHSISPDGLAIRSLYADSAQGMLDEIIKNLKDPPKTVVLDITIEGLEDPILQKFLRSPAVEKAIDEGLLNLVLLRSSQKFDMLGIDDYSGGVISVFNNNDAHWDQFNVPLRQHAITSGSSYTSMCLRRKYASTAIASYQRMVANNTRQVYTILNEKYPGLVTTTPIVEPIKQFAIIQNENQVPGFLHVYLRVDVEFDTFCKAVELAKNAMKIPDLVTTERGSFGFLTSNLLEIGIESYTCIRWTIGLEDPTTICTLLANVEEQLERLEQSGREHI